MQDALEKELEVKVGTVIGICSSLTKSWFAPNSPVEMTEFKEKRFGGGALDLEFAITTRMIDH